MADIQGLIDLYTQQIAGHRREIEQAKADISLLLTTDMMLNYYKARPHVKRALSIVKSHMESLELKIIRRLGKIEGLKVRL